MESQQRRIQEWHSSPWALLHWQLTSTALVFLLLQLLVKEGIGKSQEIQPRQNWFCTQAREKQQQVLIMVFKSSISSLCVCLQTSNSLRTHIVGDTKMILEHENTYLSINWCQTFLLSTGIRIGDCLTCSVSISWLAGSAWFCLTPSDLTGTVVKCSQRIPIHPWFSSSLL